MNLGARLKSLREEKGYSVEELATLIALTPEEVNAWEENRTTPDARGLMSLSKLYGMSIDAIIYADNSMPEYDESKGVYGSKSVMEERVCSPKEADSMLDELPDGIVRDKKEKSRKDARAKKKMTVSEWMTVFVFPVFCFLTYLCIGVFLKVWHPTWLILVLIPLYFFLYFLLRGIGNSVDDAVEDYISESERDNHENDH